MRSTGAVHHAIAIRCTCRESHVSIIRISIRARYHLQPLSARIRCSTQTTLEPKRKMMQLALCRPRVGCPDAVDHLLWRKGRVVLTIFLLSYRRQLVHSAIMPGVSALMFASIEGVATTRMTGIPLQFDGIGEDLSAGSWIMLKDESNDR